MTTYTEFVASQVTRMNERAARRGEAPEFAGETFEIVAAVESLVAAGRAAGYGQTDATAAVGYVTSNDLRTVAADAVMFSAAGARAAGL